MANGFQYLSVMQMKVDVNESGSSTFIFQMKVDMTQLKVEMREYPLSFFK